MEVLVDALKQGIAPAIVVAIYLIITKIIDTRKENIQIKLSTELTQSINNISTFILDLTKNIIERDKEKCKIAVEDSMYASAMRIINFVSNTIVHNHVDINKNNILSNIHNIVNSEYYTVYSTLSLYKIDNIRISDYLNKEWISIIEQDIIDIIFNNVLSKEDKILSFSSKINLKFQSYITFIINSSIKN